MQGGRKDRNWREGSPCITFITDKGELEEQGFNLKRIVWFIPELEGVCVCVCVCVGYVYKMCPVCRGSVPQPPP